MQLVAIRNNYQTDEWINVCVTITTNDLSAGLDNQQIYFSGFNNAGEAIIKNLKMEVGDAETKWIPAPEEGDGVNLIPNSNFYNGTSGWKNTSSSMPMR